MRHSQHFLPPDGSIRLSDSETMMQIASCGDDPVFWTIHNPLQRVEIMIYSRIQSCRDNLATSIYITYGLSRIERLIG